MLRKKPLWRPGWALVDILCCTMIVMIVTTCVTQATDMMFNIALKNREMRMKAADYLSILDEISVRVTLVDEFAYGKWKGRKIKSGSLSGLAFADVAIENEFTGEKETIERFWDIAGRR